MNINVSQILPNNFTPKKQYRFFANVKNAESKEAEIQQFLIKNISLSFQDKICNVRFVMHEITSGSDIPNIYKLWKNDKYFNIEIFFLDEMGKIWSSWIFENSQVTKLEVSQFDYSSTKSVESVVEFRSLDFNEKKYLCGSTEETNGN